MNDFNIPFIKPEFGEESIKNCLDSLKSGWLAYGGYTEQVEELFCDFFSADNFIMTSSCTASLQLALMLENIGPGDEVITTPGFEELSQDPQLPLEITKASMLYKTAGR